MVNNAMSLLLFVLCIDTSDHSGRFLLTTATAMLMIVTMNMMITKIKMMMMMMGCVTSVRDLFWRGVVANWQLHAYSCPPANNKGDDEDHVDDDYDDQDYVDDYYDDQDYMA